MLYELFLFGLLSGVTTWLFGFGGGFVAVPLLYTVIIQKYSNESMVGIHAMQIAVATSAFVMLCSASFATFRHYRSGQIDWQKIRFLWSGIALGGVVGAVMASLFNGNWLRWIFMGYVFITIIDCYYRPGFMVASRQTQNYSENSELIKGGIIGWVAALLGVGGSVMTVPLLRRRGSSMAEAAAIANILTLPLSLTATLTYCVLSLWQSTWAPSGFIGLIWFEAALFLVAGTWIGLYFSEKFISKLPDLWQARLYPLLLIIVVVVMIFVN
ncbi:sulfite exporter TauE/SafE family protein [Acinetobacter seifertii]|uniref:Probable membrane transporter protein n=1 Tax=Acinetobacter seifertii TaxID=1530123 RepID=A0A7H2RLN5_9GAMM|nr:sulfite exporter TauE/SafE family protein [Acinetobacter seifertii]QNX14130.1 sulfite exporter TauE/SafE family protein [Acinetobacter seifertii]QNX21672.1 sulfite exporter TauE/SafE family protein [Acinetobacter seifertii]QNX28268.1 sulfite exporter TauE/SafE family protein [Acinetobacter seifertii]QNX39330.1 sulfite exporter TauE/SafE family protein [Acinetobacter seifertii]QNX42947.1 sulfite exporter TauE/SafE family protein [Acinetobacter seifertii]